MFASTLNDLGALILPMGLDARIREAMGKMPRGEFARSVGVSAASVTFWLDGSTKSLSAQNAAQIERVTGYRASWIVTGRGPKRVEDRPERDDTWPFKRTTREQIVELDAEGLAFVEGAISNALTTLSTTPSPEELEMFTRAHTSSVNPKRGKKAA